MGGSSPGEGSSEPAQKLRPRSIGAYAWPRVFSALLIGLGMAAVSLLLMCLATGFLAGLGVALLVLGLLFFAFLAGLFLYYLIAYGWYKPG